MRDLIKSIKAWLAIVAGVLNPVVDQFLLGVQTWWETVIIGGLLAAAPIIARGSAILGPVVTALIDSFETAGAPLAAQISAPVSAFASGAFNKVSANIAANGPSTPDNATAAAASAFSEAFGFGISSAAVTAAFEAAFPEKLNTLNGVGPMLAQMAGFAEIAATVLGPLYRNGFGRSLDYKYRSQFTPELPTREEAQQLFARGIITAAQRDLIVSFNGLNPAWSAPTQSGAYRAIQPFLLSRAAEAGVIAPNDLNSLLTFAGFRPGDITIMLAAFAQLALQPYQQQYLVAAVRSAELGTMTAQDLGQTMTDIGLNQDQQALVQLTVATRKLEQLAELGRKTISEGYGYGTITDAQYVPMLEALGIDAVDAEVHYQYDSVKRLGKAAVAAERAATKLANQQARAGQKAAIASFRTGTIDAAALTAALLLAQMDPAVAGFTVAIEEQRQLGPLVYVYGVELSRSKALVLREKVTALGRQVSAQLVTPADALAQLASLGIPAANAEALVAGWAASHITAADVGVKLPI